MPHPLRAISLSFTTNAHRWQTLKEIPIKRFQEITPGFFRQKTKPKLHFLLACLLAHFVPRSSIVRKRSAFLLRNCYSTRCPDYVNSIHFFSLFIFFFFLPYEGYNKLSCALRLASLPSSISRSPSSLLTLYWFHRERSACAGRLPTLVNLKFQPLIRPAFCTSENMRKRWRLPRETQFLNCDTLHVWHRVWGLLIRPSCVSRCAWRNAWRNRSAVQVPTRIRLVAREYYLIWNISASFLPFLE